MNHKKTTEYIKKFKPVNATNYIIFLDTLELPNSNTKTTNNTHILVQDDKLKLILWQISQVSFRYNGQLQLPSIINCYQLVPIRSTSDKVSSTVYEQYHQLIIGGKNGCILIIQIKIRQYNDNNNKYQLRITNQLKTEQSSPIKYMIPQYTNIDTVNNDTMMMIVIDQLGKCYQLQSSKQQTIIKQINNDDIDNNNCFSRKINYLSSPLVINDSKQYYICMLVGSNIPYLITKQNILTLLLENNSYSNKQKLQILTEQLPTYEIQQHKQQPSRKQQQQQIKQQQNKLTNDIMNINNRYIQQIDQHFSIASDIQIAISTKYNNNNNNNNVIVVAQSTGILHIFTIQQLSQQQSSYNNSTLPYWYTKQLIIQSSIQINKQIYSIDTYHQYLVVCSDNKVMFIDLQNKTKIFQSLQQKQNSLINQVRWTNNQKIVLASVLSNTPKLYLFSKQLPIKSNKSKNVLSECGNRSGEYILGSLH